jgi:hypothetical protein
LTRQKAVNCFQENKNSIQHSIYEKGAEVLNLG